MTRNRPKSKAHVVSAIAEGLEAPPEIADRLWTSIAQVDLWLEELLAEGKVAREAKPTFRGRSGKTQYYRYRLKEAVGATIDG